MKLESRAYLFACICHMGQLRKDGTTPYIVHPCQVVSLLKSVGIDDDHNIAVAYLHDVIEDTSRTYEDIEQKFGKKVADDVLLLTQEDGQTKDDYFAKISKASVEVRNIKMADRICNLRNIKYDNVDRDWFDKYTGKTRKHFKEWTSGTNRKLLKMLNDILEMPYGKIIDTKEVKRWKI